MRRLALLHIVYPTCLILPWAPAAPGEIGLGAARDATLYEEGAGLLANGSGAFLFTGSTADEEIRRALLFFDVAGAVPRGSTIVGVTLRLHMSRTISGDQTISLHRIEADWGEGASDAPGEEGGGTASAPGDATWLHAFYDDVLWTAPGGDFSPEGSAARDVGGAGSYTWGPDEAMRADVQLWLDEPERNFGWILTGEEGEPGTAKRFDSRETPRDVDRPLLTVEFTSPAAFFVRGDANADGALDIGDAVCTLDHLFAGGASPCGEAVARCLDAADVNDDGAVDIADAVFLLGHLFAGARPPPPPYGECGPDGSPDEIDCAEHEPCPPPP